MTVDLAKIANHFGLGPYLSSSELLGGYANKNYHLITEKGHFLLRLCNQQPLECLNYELRLMKILKEHDFPTAYPLSATTGDFIHFQDKSIFMLYEFKAGREPSPNTKTADEIGAAVGQLSTVSDFDHLRDKINTLDQLHTANLIDQFSRAKNPITDIFDFIERYANRFNTINMANLPEGFVHGDMFTNNTIFDEDDNLIAIVDFEEACIDHLLLDIGMTINGFCFIKNQLDTDLLISFLTSYQTYRKLTSSEVCLLLPFIQFAAFSMLCWHMRFCLVDIPNEKQEIRIRELMERIHLLETVYLEGIMRAMN